MDFSLQGFFHFLQSTYRRCTALLPQFTMAPLLTTSERKQRILMNVKGNKPIIMAMKFEHYHRAEEAKQNGEAYIPPPEFTFFIHDEDGETPITLQTIQEIVNKRKPRQTSSTSTTAECVQEELTDDPLHLQTARVLSGHDFDTTGEEVKGIKLRGNVRGWWNKLTEMLQPEDWPNSMVYYVEHLQDRVLCGGVKMDALRIRRHFEDGEVEDGGEETR